MYFKNRRNQLKPSNRVGKIYIQICILFMVLIKICTSNIDTHYLKKNICFIYNKASLCDVQDEIRWTILDENEMIDSCFWLEYYVYWLGMLHYFNYITTAVRLANVYFVVSTTFYHPWCWCSIWCSWCFFLLKEKY